MARHHRPAPPRCGDPRAGLRDRGDRAGRRAGPRFDRSVAAAAAGCRRCHGRPLIHSGLRTAAVLSGNRRPRQCCGRRSRDRRRPRRGGPDQNGSAPRGAPRSLCRYRVRRSWCQSRQGRRLRPRDRSTAQRGRRGNAVRRGRHRSRRPRGALGATRGQPLVDDRGCDAGLQPAERTGGKAATGGVPRLRRHAIREAGNAGSIDVERRGCVQRLLPGHTIEIE